MWGIFAFLWLLCYYSSMDEKIQQLIPILTDLQGSWEYADPLLQVLYSWHITIEKLDTLISLLSHSLSILKNREYSGKTQFFQEVINEAKQREIREQQREQKQEADILANIL